VEIKGQPGMWLWDWQTDHIKNNIIDDFPSRIDGINAATKESIKYKDFGHRSLSLNLNASYIIIYYYTNFELYLINLNVDLF